MEESYPGVWLVNRFRETAAEAKDESDLLFSRVGSLDSVLFVIYEVRNSAKSCLDI
jgi:hypothetical protein